MLLPGVKGHSGYHKCEKCIQEDLYVEFSTFFPGTDMPVRTYQDFRDKKDDDHHLGNSPLENTSQGMVSEFPLDYMHRLCLGVMHCLLILWLKGPLTCRLSAFQVNKSHRGLWKLAMPSPFSLPADPGQWQRLIGGKQQR